MTINDISHTSKGLFDSEVQTETLVDTKSFPRYVPYPGRYVQLAKKEFMGNSWLVTLTIALVIFLMAETHAQEATVAHKDSLKQTVELYYSLNLKVFQQNSTKEDIDKLFNLFTEDFVYVHPKYGGEYSREDSYEGYLNNQNNGSYNGSIVDVKTKNMIVGLNALVIERAYVSRSKSGEPEEVDSGMTLFEFKAGKISKIFEYW